MFKSCFQHLGTQWNVPVCSMVSCFFLAANAMFLFFLCISKIVAVYWTSGKCCNVFSKYKLKYCTTVRYGNVYWIHLFPHTTMLMWPGRAGCGTGIAGPSWESWAKGNAGPLRCPWVTHCMGPKRNFRQWSSSSNWGYNQQDVTTRRKYTSRQNWWCNQQEDTIMKKTDGVINKMLPQEDTLISSTSTNSPKLAGLTAPE